MPPHPEKKRSKNQSVESMKKKFPLAFCSLSLTLSSLLMRGLKFVGSLRKVIRSRSKKVFIPESKLCGECAVVYARKKGGKRGRGWERGCCEKTQRGWRPQDIPGGTEQNCAQQQIMRFAVTRHNTSTAK